MTRPAAASSPLAAAPPHDRPPALYRCTDGCGQGFGAGPWGGAKWSRRWPRGGSRPAPRPPRAPATRPRSPLRHPRHATPSALAGGGNRRRTKNRLLPAGAVRCVRIDRYRKMPLFDSLFTPIAQQLDHRFAHLLPLTPPPPRQPSQTFCSPRCSQVRPVRPRSRRAPHRLREPNAQQLTRALRRRRHCCRLLHPRNQRLLRIRSRSKTLSGRASTASTNLSLLEDAAAGAGAGAEGGSWLLQKTRADGDCGGHPHISAKRQVNSIQNAKVHDAIHADDALNEFKYSHNDHVQQL